MKKGFTLADVLITCVVLGVILALFLPNIFYKGESKVIDNTNWEKSYSVQDKYCKTMTVDISPNGLIIRCRDF